MKSFTIASAIVALSTLSAATPTPSWNDWKGKGPKAAMSPFEFTSVYKVVATPDQVINGTVVTPGEPGAIGYFNFGINSYLDTICYVRHYLHTFFHVA